MNDEKIKTLKELEDIITRSKKKWYEAAMAFKAIRDGAFAEMQNVPHKGTKEYREHLNTVLGFPTLEEYWKGKWGITQRHVNRLIETAELVNADSSGPASPDGLSVNEVRRKAKAAREVISEEEDGQEPVSEEPNYSEECRKAASAIKTFVRLLSPKVKELAEMNLTPPEVYKPLTVALWKASKDLDVLARAFFGEGEEAKAA